MFAANILQKQTKRTQQQHKSEQMNNQSYS